MNVWQTALTSICFLIFSSCGNNASKEKELDRYYKGVLHISCDETFKPVIDQTVKVYESMYPDVSIRVQYKPEAECLQDFLVDSIKMIIATRGYSPSEEQLIIDSLRVGPEKLVIAKDLIAVIVHPSSPDSVFSMDELRSLLSGKLKKNLIPVFDGTRATSTVRYMLDSVMISGELTTKAVAAQSSVEVIEYVSKTPNAVGFVGFSWIGNMDDPVQDRYREMIRTAWIESTDSVDAYVHPSQLFIYTKSYPLVRDLVYTMKETHTGLAHGFSHFLETMQGQLIFRRAYLMPVIYPNYLREAEVIDSINN